MERLWAPWRHEYILKASQPGCFLCDAIQSGRDRDHLILKRGEHVLAILNRYPYNNGHLMLAPYRHVGDITDLSAPERAEIMDMTAEMLTLLRSAIRPDGFNIGFNLGKTAGAGLEAHLHQHIVPRWNGDTNFMPVVGQTKVMPQSLEATLDGLLRALKA